MATYTKVSKEKRAFVHRLAVFLAEKSASKGLLLEIESSRIVSDQRPRLATDWKELRELVPGVTGATSIPEMEALLHDVLK